MQTRIRTAQPEDYPALTEIHNSQNHEHFHTTAERLQAHHAQCISRDTTFQRVIAEAGGQPIGSGTLYSMRWTEAEPGRYWTDLHVLPQHRHQGVDTMMLRHMLAAAGSCVQEVLSLMREDYASAAGFLTDEGFSEHFRSWGAHLDPRKFDPAPFEHLERQLAEDGVHIRLYQQLAGDADRAGKLLALQLEVEADVQAFGPVIPRHESNFPGPDAILDATFVAVTDTGDYVGLACLEGKPGQTHLGTGLTGVARSHRGHGIATALKVRTILAAQQLGCIDLNTGGGGSDTAMMRINRKVGFEIEPAWITFRSER